MMQRFLYPGRPFRETLVGTVFSAMLLSCAVAMDLGRQFALNMLVLLMAVELGNSP